MTDILSLIREITIPSAYFPWIAAWYALINIVAYLLYGLDKKKARKHAWRIPERTLLMSAALGGGIGAWLGMNVFRHKTQHMRFTVLVPAFIMLHVLWWIVYAKA